MGVWIPGLIPALLLLGFSISECFGKQPELSISPTPPLQTKAVGKSAVLTCQPDVDNKNLITELVWKDPQNRTIDANYINRQWATTEVMDDSLALILNSFQESQAGDYTCSATYANDRKLYKVVRLEPIHPIKFEDAPEVQNPIINQEYKIRCKVTANPAPHVDWAKNNEAITGSDRYVIEPDGLRISKVTESDDGTYICRALVIKTGELATKVIKVEVHTPPTILPMNNTVEVIEGETASVQCSAQGKPKPSFAWIRNDNSANVATTPRFRVDEVSGLMVIQPVQENDHGEYKCVASNAAANSEKIIKLVVNIKPKIADIVNATTVERRSVTLECVARGRPLPEITFRKYGSVEPLLKGVNAYDPRISVVNRRGGQENEIIGVLQITNVQRSDDGLYECIATNSAAKAFKTGHITVEFPPSFANTPMTEAYTWDRRPINLTCLAESIPNATISWRLNDREFPLNEYNIRQFGAGPISTITVTPVDHKYYGNYKCMAFNPHGNSSHTIYLKEAFRPSVPLQVVVESHTATTVKFKISGPQHDGGIPIRSYIVQYIEARQTWMNPRNRSWTIGNPYVVEDLIPEMGYNFRFAAQNDVGLGPWSGETYHVMPRFSRPGTPEILNVRGDDFFVQSEFDTKFSVKWKIPPDNGQPIDFYYIRICEVALRGINYDNIGSCTSPITLYTAEHRSTTYLVQGLMPDTRYRLQLVAHNILGESQPGEVLFRTARGIDKDHLVASSQGLVLTSGAIVGIVVASLLVILLIIDVSCYFVNRAGVLYLMCGSKKKTAQDENKLTSEEKEPLKENGRPKVEVMDERLKKDTRITYDDKNSTVKTSFIGKDSAV